MSPVLFLILVICIFLFSLFNTAVQVVKGIPGHWHWPVTVFPPPQVPAAAPLKSTSQAGPAAERPPTLFRKSKEPRREDETEGSGPCVYFQTRRFSSLMTVPLPFSQHTAGCSVPPNWIFLPSQLTECSLAASVWCRGPGAQRAGLPVLCVSRADRQSVRRGSRSPGADRPGGGVPQGQPAQNQNRRL